MIKVPKKILFISHDASRTGAPMVLLNLIKWIRTNSGFNLRILLRAGGALEPEFRALGETHVLDDANGNPALVRDVSLIFSNTCTNGYFIETLPYGNIPVITHVHEMPAIIESYGAENLRVVKKQTTRFIACSEAVLEGLVGLGIDREKISTIHESIPTGEVLHKAAEKSRDQIKAWHGWEDYEHIVAACGVADWRKGADLFVQVAQAVKRKIGEKRKILFLWVGVLPPDERGKLLTNDIRQLGLENTVHFLGEQTNPYAYLAAADVFCLTSREDPFPLVMLEGATLSKPTICFQNSGGGEEFCKRGGGVTVPFLDIEAMADGILHLLADESTRKNLGMAAAKLVAENFDLSVSAPRFLCEIEKYGRRISTPAIGYAQVYFPSADGYSEGNSKSIRVLPARWTRLQVVLPPAVLASEEPLFLDPIAMPALIEVTGITFKTKAGRILWRAGSEELAQILVAIGVRIPCSRVLKFVSFDKEARLVIPIPQICKAECGESLTIEWWQKISTDHEELAMACRDLRDSHNIIPIPPPPPVDAVPEPAADIAVAPTAPVDSTTPEPPVDSIAPPVIVAETPTPPQPVETVVENESDSGKPGKTPKTLRFLQKILKT